MTPIDTRYRPLVSFDWAMKRLLRNKANFAALEGFLSVLLNRIIKIDQILESESNRDTPEDKQTKMDILVESEDGELMIIELQYADEQDYFQRMLYGTSRVITEHIFKGDGYANIKKVYSINIVYFDLGEGKDYVYHGKMCFHGLHYKDDILQLTSIQRERLGKKEAGEVYPEYYLLKVKHFDDVAKDSLDEWIYYLKHNKIEPAFTARGLDVARQIFDYDALPTDEKRSYDRAAEYHGILANQYLTATENGIEEGIKRGREEGLEKGREEGLEKGRREEKEQIVLNSLNTGLSTDTICAITGLSEKEIQTIIIRQG
jgi:predicted transposase/invertase (TIGR01784 family)